jgi:hypothetical protein
MDDQILQAIHRRIDEHHAYLSDRLDALQEAMNAHHEALVRRVDNHEAYHRRNEHRFGPGRLAERHPLRLASLAFIAGGLFLVAAPNSLRCLIVLVQAIARGLSP